MRMENHSLSGAAISHNDMYITRLPSPPGIRVLPASWHQHFSFTEPIQRDASIPEFLREIDWSPFEYPPPADDWSYEDRRRAQTIFPFLAIGPTSAVKDHEYIRARGITAVIAVRHRHMASSTSLASAHLTQAIALGVEVHTFDVSDSNGLVAVFPEAIKIINSHLSMRRAKNLASGIKVDTPGVVLVVCESGNQRAPAVAAAYLIDALHQDFVTAIQYVNCRRFCCDLNEPLKRALQAYQDVVKARRDVISAHMDTLDRTSVNLQARSTSKRTWKQSSGDGHDDSDYRHLGEPLNTDTRFFAPFGD